MRSRGDAGNSVGRPWTVAAIAAVLVLAIAAVWYAALPRRYTAVARVAATPRSSTTRAAQVDATIAVIAGARPVLEQAQVRIGTSRSLATLDREVVAVRLPGTEIIEVRVTDGNAGFAARAANAVVAVLPLFDPTRGKVTYTDAGRATAPASASQPEAAMFWSIAVVLALCAGGVAASLATIGRRRVRGADDVRRRGVRVLGELDAPADVSAVSVTTSDAAAAQFRRIRVALEFVGSTMPTRVIVLAPVSDDPAASWLAVNLAASLARVRHRVLIIDADPVATVRHPALDQPGDGIAEVLAGGLRIRDAAMSSELAGVSVLPLGEPALLRDEPLFELNFASAIAELDEDEFDLALVLAAPLDASDDARVLAAGHSMLVSVAAGRTTLRSLEVELDELHRMGLRLLGTTVASR